MSTSGLIMKLTRTLALILAALAATPVAYAACASDDPVVLAKSFYSKHVNFSSENPAKIKTLITPRFFAALDKEFKCAQGQICSIEADPWTGAQDGDVGKPIEFAATSNSGVAANVSMTYPFVLGKAHREQKQVSLLFQRQSPTDCWLLDDLLTPGGGSLVQSIEAWFKEYGNAL